MFELDRNLSSFRSESFSGLDRKLILQLTGFSLFGAALLHGRQLPWKTGISTAEFNLIDLLAMGKYITFSTFTVSTLNYRHCVMHTKRQAPNLSSLVGDQHPAGSVVNNAAGICGLKSILGVRDAANSCLTRGLWPWSGVLFLRCTNRVQFHSP